jgi:uncharacterized membrane protein
MGKGRIEAFSDGVIAILITIMVLELKVPHGADLPSLRPLLPVFLNYVLSFIYLGIYWNNHHHMFHAMQRVNGRILWANLHLLFWLSLIPFATGWMGENHFESWPVALYGVVLLMAGVSYTVLLSEIVAEPHNTALAAAIGSDYKGKLSLALYIIAVAVSFILQWVSIGIYILVAAMWFIPDRRIESRMKD